MEVSNRKKFWKSYPEHARLLFRLGRWAHGLRKAYIEDDRELIAKKLGHCRRIIGEIEIRYPELFRGESIQ